MAALLKMQRATVAFDNEWIRRNRHFPTIVAKVTTGARAHQVSRIVNEPLRRATDNP
jgi:hypothetical protein